MRTNRPRYIEVVNTSNQDRILRDVSLPGGELLIRAGESLDIPAATYLKTQRRNARWMIRKEKLEARRAAEKQAKEAQKAATAAEAAEDESPPKKRGRKN